jgi:hypothetical protein
MAGVVESVTGALDHAAGSVDESIGRQFDDEPGGGFADIGPVVTEDTGVFSPSCSELSIKALSKTWDRPARSQSEISPMPQRMHPRVAESLICSESSPV